MTSSTSSSERLPRWVALLAPLAVLGLASWLLWPPPPAQDGVAPPVESLAEDCRSARLVLVGDSKVRSDLNPRELEQFLDLPHGAVASLTLHGSTAPVWFAILKNLVYGRGCAPGLVVVYGSIDRLLAADVSPDERVRLLAPVLTSHEPEIAARLGWRDAAPDTWTRSRQEVLRRRDGLLGRVAAGTVGLLLRSDDGHGDAGAPWARGRKALDAASARVFGPGGWGAPVDPGTLPVQAPPAPGRARLAAQPRDTFLPEFAALATAMDTRIVLVRAPLRDGAQARETLAVPGLVEGSRTFAEGAGMGFLDLSEAVLAPEAWVDERHLGAMGSTRITRALAASLVAGGWLPEAASPGAPVLPQAAWLLDRPRRFEQEPPPVTLEGLRPEGVRLATLQVQPPLPVGDQHCLEHEVWKCCSPLRVYEDDRLLPEPNVAPQLVRSLGAGRYTHLGDHVLVSSRDGGPPGDRGYRAVLDPARWCGSLWLYPGDHMVIDDLGVALAELGGRAGAVELLVRGFGASPWTLELTVGGGEAPPGSQRLEVSPGGERFVRVPLDEPLEAGIPDLALGLRSMTNEGFTLVSHLALVP